MDALDSPAPIALPHPHGYAHHTSRPEIKAMSARAVSRKMMAPVAIPTFLHISPMSYGKEDPP